METAKKVYKLPVTKGSFLSAGLDTKHFFLKFSYEGGVLTKNKFLWVENALNYVTYEKNYELL